MTRYKELLGVFALLCSTAAGYECPVLAPVEQSTLVQYVRKEYKIEDKTDLKLSREKGVNGSCYRELTFQGKNSIKTWEITMYLSPDKRFLTGELIDTTIDPVEAERRKAQALMAGLAENKDAMDLPPILRQTVRLSEKHVFPERTERGVYRQFESGTCT